MSNYTQSTNFATKDALTSGDPLKIVKGTEINTEFVNISVAIATKADLASPTFTGNVTGTFIGNLTGNATTATTATTAGNVTNTVAIANGGTGATTAATAFAALKQAATDTATGVVELATTAEAATGTDTTRAITPASLFGGLNASGSAPIYACRAWVNFDGTGVVAISASGNVSSITDNGTGDFTLNFVTALTDANYAATFGSMANVQIQNTSLSLPPVLMSTTQFRIYITGFDTTTNTVAIFR